MSGLIKVSELEAERRRNLAQLKEVAIAELNEAITNANNRSTSNRSVTYRLIGLDEVADELMQELVAAGYTVSKQHALGGKFTPECDVLAISW